MTGEAGGQHSEPVSPTEEWPTFAIRYTFNPDDIAGRDRIDPDELVVFDPRTPGIGTAWITAARGSYVSIEDAR